MLIRVGEDRSGAIDLVLAAILSSIAGALNAVGFLITGYFSANMTGNLSTLADDLAVGAFLTSLFLAGLLLAFVAGAAVAAGAIYWGERRRIRSIYAIAIALEGFIVLALGLALSRATLGQGGWGLVVVLSSVMGLQNAATTMISRSRVRTTHVSGMATDIGIELAALLTPDAQRREALPKLRLHCVTLLAFLLGGVLGALLYGLLGYGVFSVCGLALIVVALPEVLRAHRTRG